jgi:hypothetical protein
MMIGREERRGEKINIRKEIRAWEKRKRGEERNGEEKDNMRRGEEISWVKSVEELTWEMYRRKQKREKGKEKTGI